MNDNEDEIQRQSQALLERVQADRAARPEVYEQRQRHNLAALAEFETGWQLAAEGIRTWEELAEMLDMLLNNLSARNVRPEIPHEALADIDPDTDERTHQWRVPEHGVDEAELIATMRLLLRDASALAAAYRRGQKRIDDNIEDLRSILSHDPD